MFQSGVGEFDLNKIISLGGKDNSISSIIVPMAIMLLFLKMISLKERQNYSHQKNYRAKDLGSWYWNSFNNKISSFIIFPENDLEDTNDGTGINDSKNLGAKIFSDKFFEGESAHLSEGIYNKDSLSSLEIKDNTVSSIKVYPGYEAVLFYDDDFTGGLILLQENMKGLELKNSIPIIQLHQ